MEGAEAGVSGQREVRISDDARSEGRRVYDCQAVGENLTILDGLGGNESDAQTKGEKSKSKSAFDHHSNGGRDKRKVIPSFSAFADCGRVRQPTVVAAHAVGLPGLRQIAAAVINEW